MKYLIIILISLASHMLEAKAKPKKASQPSQPTVTSIPNSKSLANEQTQHVSALRVIREKCVRCHSGEKPPNGLDLTTVDNMVKGGKSGPAIIRYKPYDSLIWKAVTAQDGFFVMPPYDRLPEIEIEAIRIWIYHGAMQSSMSGQEP